MSHPRISAALLLTLGCGAETSRIDLHLRHNSAVSEVVLAIATATAAAPFFTRSVALDPIARGRVETSTLVIVLPEGWIEHTVHVRMEDALDPRIHDLAIVAIPISRRASTEGELIQPCSDGDLDGSEGCDDANRIAGDGCSPACKVEASFRCSGEPSTCAPGCGGDCACAPGACCSAACGSGQICEPGLLTCTSGCACALDCKGATECRPECRGSPCAIDCAGAQTCVPECSAGGRCAIECRGRDTRECSASCVGAGTICEIDCDTTTRDCDQIVCRDGAACLLRCHDRSDHCAFGVCGGTAIDCGGGVFVCGRACP